MLAWRNEFHYLVLETIFYHSKIKFISLRRRVKSSIYLYDIYNYNIIEQDERLICHIA